MTARLGSIADAGILGALPYLLTPFPRSDRVQEPAGYSQVGSPMSIEAEANDVSVLIEKHAYSLNRKYAKL
jgi:hypothetical protein